jgi:hypothetical protein
VYDENQQDGTGQRNAPVNDSKSGVPTIRLGHRQWCEARCYRIGGRPGAGSAVGRRLVGDLYRAGSAHGGLVLLKEQLENGEWNVRLHYLDDLNSHIRGAHLSTSGGTRYFDEKT